MKIEFINRVELQGIIGSVRQYTIGTQKGFQLTVATNRVYRDKDGNPVIETQLHRLGIGKHRPFPTGERPGNPSYRENPEPEVHRHRRGGTHYNGSGRQLT